LSFYNFLINKAAEYGHQCPQCGENDGYFALNGKCNKCKSPLIRYGKELSLLFSLEVFIEFIDHHVDKGSVFEKKEIREMLEGTIIGLKENIPRVDVDELAEIQKIFTSGAEIKGGITGGALVLNKTATEIISFTDPATTPINPNFDGLVGAIFAIQFITVVRFKNKITK